MVLEHNKDIKRVQGVIIFTSAYDMNKGFLTKYPDLVMAVTDEFSDLTKKFNQVIKKIESQTRYKYNGVKDSEWTPKVVSDCGS